MSYYGYINNIIKGQAFFNTDTGIVFEFVPGQATQNYTLTPTFPQNLGFKDASAISVIDIPSSLLNNLFYFQLSNTLDISNIQVMNYGINTRYTFNLLFSKSKMTYTQFFPNAPLANDYLYFLAHSLTGSTNINVFTNTTNLYQSVADMDSGFNIAINRPINFARIGSPTQYFLSNDITNSFVHSTKQLITGMLQIANPIRKRVFLNDLIDQSVNNTQNIYWVPFHSGDKMSLLITYVSTYPGIHARSYKIILNCIATFIFPNSVSNVGFNPAGNLDPFYILNLVNNISLEGQPQSQGIDSNFITRYNTIGQNYFNEMYTDNIFIPIFKKMGFLINPLDFYYKTFLTSPYFSQPSTINIDGTGGITNNGLNLSFQYIYLNSTITTNLYPSLRSIKTSLLTSPYNIYPTLNDIHDIQCDLNIDNSQNFIIRIYTRPNYNQIDNQMNSNDTFYGNFYDSAILSDISGIETIIENNPNGYNTYHLGDLFNYWSVLMNSEYNQHAYYINSGLVTLSTFGEQEILSICILTYDINANIGIKNIIVTYK
uniref:Uncharacterized protein n=1 Tax=viral metagenome TaxID=1070528 RepID=A0A6C0D3Z2_9ZZZZ